MALDTVQALVSRFSDHQSEYTPRGHGVRGSGSGVGVGKTGVGGWGSGVWVESKRNSQSSSGGMQSRPCPRGSRRRGFLRPSGLRNDRKRSGLRNDGQMLRPALPFLSSRPTGGISSISYPFSLWKRGEKLGLAHAKRSGGVPVPAFRGGICGGGISP